MKPKVVITGGCSYSQVPNKDFTWPIHLIKSLTPDIFSTTGHGGSGNEVISRYIISSVQHALDDGYKAEDMLVGVAWSGCDRAVYYSDTIDRESASELNQITVIPFLNNGGISPVEREEFFQNIVNKRHPRKNWPVNGLINIADIDAYCDNLGGFWSWNHPLNIRSTKNAGFYTLNAHWDDELSIGYYSNYTNPVYAIMQTCEHVLRTQWFLKSLNIKYFMTEYDHDVFTYMGPYDSTLYTNPNQLEGFSILKKPGCWDNDIKHKEEMNIIYDHPEVSYLYDMIDKDHWLPVRDLKNWTMEESPYGQRDPTDPHPSSEQQKDFTKRVILPFLLEKYNIS
jgi:hypothetical protein